MVCGFGCGRVVYDFCVVVGGCGFFVGSGVCGCFFMDVNMWLSCWGVCGDFVVGCVGSWFGVVGLVGVVFVCSVVGG